MKKEIVLSDLSLFLIEKFQRIVFNTDECIIWPDSKNRKGYGLQNFHIKGEYVHSLAHRISYLIFSGNLPTEKQVCHICDNPSCINPKHLFLGTNQENAQDCTNKGRNTGVYRGQEQSKINRNFSSKLSFEDVKEIRKLNKEGGSYSYLANIYKVDRTAIRDIVKFRSRLNS